MGDERWPCQRNPDRWFSTDRRELGRAVHECLSHCTRLVECDATEARPRSGVLAGVYYVASHDSDEPQPERRTLHEVPCPGCVLEPMPKPEPTGPTDTGACGEPKGYHRHTRLGQVPCGPCTVAKAEYQREKYREWARLRVEAWAS